MKRLSVFLSHSLSRLTNATPEGTTETESVDLLEWWQLGDALTKVGVVSKSTHRTDKCQEIAMLPELWGCREAESEEHPQASQR